MHLLFLYTFSCTLQVMAEMRTKFGEGPENLEYMMWRSIAMRVAINVLMDQSQYQVRPMHRPGVSELM